MYSLLLPFALMAVLAVVAVVVGLVWWLTRSARNSPSDGKPGPLATGADPASPSGPDPVGIFAEAAADRAPPAPAPAVAELAAHFPELELLDLIGQGGMGAVYRVRRLADAAMLALKVVRISDEDLEGFAQRFEREAEALTRLDHPHIVAIRGHGRAGPWCWLLMDLVDGANLRQVVATGRLSPAQTLALVPPLCAALQYAHDRGVVHRDIKPENILLDAAGNPRIVDFGLAKLRRPGEDANTRTGAVMGTPHYMAPEQVEEAKDVDHRADIYALGVVVYELLTGRLPLGRFEPPSHRVAVDVRIDEVVLKALERDPERRWQQAGQVGRAVDAIGRSSAGPAGAEVPVAAGSAVQAWGMEVSTFCTVLHLSQFAGFIIPMAGWILPLVMWLTCRQRHPAIEHHGRVVVNWLISQFIYLIVCVALCFVLIGIPLVIALVVCGLIFPILGAVRASRGEVWNYPLAIPFCGRGEALQTAESGRPASRGGMGCLLVIVIAGVPVALAGAVYALFYFRAIHAREAIVAEATAEKTAYETREMIRPLVASLHSDYQRGRWPVQGSPRVIIGRIYLDQDRAFDEEWLRNEIARQMAEIQLNPITGIDGPEASANLELSGRLIDVSTTKTTINGRPWGDYTLQLTLSLKAIESQAEVWHHSVERTVSNHSLE
jgi:uncharacterized Tic20 family protein